MSDMVKYLIGEAKFTKAFTDLLPGMVLLFSLLLIQTEGNRNQTLTLEKRLLELSAKIEELNLEKEILEDFISIFRSKMKSLKNAESNALSKEIKTLAKLRKEIVSYEKEKKNLIYENNLHLPNFDISWIKNDTYLFLLTSIFLGVMVSQISRCVFMGMVFKSEDSICLQYYIGNGRITKEQADNVITTYYNYVELATNHFFPVVCLGWAITYNLVLSDFITVAILTAFAFILVSYLLFISGIESYNNYKKKIKSLVAGATEKDKKTEEKTKKETKENISREEDFFVETSFVS